MAYVITETCVGTCDTACVDVCPMDCIAGPLPLEELRGEGGAQARASGLQLYIDPVACIDCSACLPVCPVDAIYPDDEVPGRFAGAVERNADFFEVRAATGGGA